MDNTEMGDHLGIIIYLLFIIFLIIYYSGIKETC